MENNGSDVYGYTSIFDGLVWCTSQCSGCDAWYMMCWLEFWLTIDCSLELEHLTARSEDGAETLPCLPPSPSYSSPNWWQAGSPSGPVSEYPTPLSCPPPLCGSPQLLAGLSHLSFRATTALEETLLCPPTLSTTQTLNLSSRPYFYYFEVLLFCTKIKKCQQSSQPELLFHEILHLVGSLGFFFFNFVTELGEVSYKNHPVW